MFIFHARVTRSLLEHASRFEILFFLFLSSLQFALPFRCVFFLYDWTVITEPRHCCCGITILYQTSKTRLALQQHKTDQLI